MPRITPRNIAKLDSIPDVNAGSPSDNDALTWDNATGKWIPEAVAGGNGGQTLYDAIVAPSGGDYTSVVTACATEAIGATIFIRKGTYTETADIVLKNKQKLIGESREETIIDFDNAAYQVYGLNLAGGVALMNLTIKNSADTNGAVYLSGCTYSHIKNCKIVAGSTITHGIYYIGHYSIVEDCIITGFSASSKYGLRVNGDYVRVYGNYFENCKRAIRINYWGVVTGNVIRFTEYGVWPKAYSVITGNSFYSTSRNAVYGSGNLVISGNYFTSCRVYCTSSNITITGNTFFNYAAFYVGAGYTNITITGNIFENCGSMPMLGTKCIVSNNNFYANSYLSLYTGEKNIVVGNNFSGSTAATKLSDTGVGNIIKNNSGIDVLLEKDFNRMKNTSGGALVAGDIVVLKAVAAGDEVTTTTVQGDDKVYGMVEEAINDNAYGLIQSLGKTVRLKVDGTTDIAIGDFIGTFTSAKIGMKAAAGDMAIAIALEAYATDDSAGVIDALLITPRKI